MTLYVTKINTNRLFSKRTIRKRWQWTDTDQYRKKALNLVSIVDFTKNAASFKRSISAYDMSTVCPPANVGARYRRALADLERCKTFKHDMVP